MMFNNNYLNKIFNTLLKFIIQTRDRLALQSTGRFHGGPVSVKAIMVAAVAEVFNLKYIFHV